MGESVGALGHGVYIGVMGDESGAEPVKFDEPVLLFMNEVLAIHAILARLERALIDDDDLADRFVGLGGSGSVTHLPATADCAEAPRVDDADTAREYLQTVQRRLKTNPTFSRLFEPQP